MESLTFIALTPLGAALMVAVGVVAWRRRDGPGGWALVAFSASELGWLACDALALLAETPEATTRWSQAGLSFASTLAVAWIWFVLSYTGRLTRAGGVALGVLAGWAAVYGGLALTNDAHGWVWSTWGVASDGPFSYLVYALGPVGWAQTVASWAAVAVSLVVLLRAYAGAGSQARTLSRWIVAGALVPMGLSVAFLVGGGGPAKDFTPLSMGLSSAAFAVGLARYRFLDLRPAARAALVERLPHPMLVLDLDGRIVDANPALARLLGGAEPVGRAVSDALPPELARAVAALGGEREAHAEATVRTPGGPRHFDIAVTPLTSRDGERTGRLAMLRDVTRRRGQREALESANRALRDRNAELDAFAHTVAHDLRTPLHGILGYAALLLDPGLDPDVRGDAARAVRSQAWRLNGIIEDLLLLAGVGRQSVEPVPLAMGPLVDGALARVAHLTEATDARVVGPARWPSARGHGPWVEAVWANYLSNAAKYGGHAPRIEIGADTAGGRVRFWVQDHGPGLDADQQARLFRPFARVTAEPIEGHGLGLSIVRRIVDRLDGDCGVESAPGRGSRFWFELPAAQAAPVEAPALVAG